MKKIYVVKEIQEGLTEETFFKSEAEAIEAARDAWRYMAKEDKKRIKIEVAEVIAGKYPDYDPVEWRSAEELYEVGEITLTQEPYLTGTNDKPHYEAAATDKDGNNYSITWEIFDSYDPAEDPEELSCDWDRPETIKRIYL